METCIWWVWNNENSDHSGRVSIPSDGLRLKTPQIVGFKGNFEDVFWYPKVFGACKTLFGQALHIVIALQLKIGLHF